MKRQFKEKELELNWNKFLEYYLFTLCMQKKLELLAVRQENMFVVDYKAKFAELSRFALHLVEKEEDKVMAFQNELQFAIRQQCGTIHQSSSSLLR